MIDIFLANFYIRMTNDMLFFVQLEWENSNNFVLAFKQQSDIWPLVQRTYNRKQLLLLEKSQEINIFRRRCSWNKETWITTIFTGVIMRDCLQLDPQYFLFYTSYIEKQGVKVVNFFKRTKTTQWESKT